MEINLGMFAVRFVDGSIDHEGTISKFANELSEFAANQEAENATISQAIHAMFDQYKGARLNMPYLTGEVLRRLEAKPDTYKVLTDKVQGFIRSQSQGKTLDDGSVENPQSVFVISKGKGGGVSRRVDQPNM